MHRSSVPHVDHVRLEFSARWCIRLSKCVCYAYERLCHVFVCLGRRRMPVSVAFQECTAPILKRRPITRKNLVSALPPLGAISCIQLT